MGIPKKPRSTSMKVHQMPIGDIRPYDRNPRVNEQAVDAVARSIERFGFRQPIVVDKANVIIVGHVRYKAALRLGLAEVPVHVAIDLTPEEIKAYRIADNRLNDMAEWDFELLAGELAGLDAVDFDLDLLGFSETELSELLNADLTGGLTDPDEVPEPPDEPITQPGDLWILGEHRLLCGDAGANEDVDRLLDGAVNHLVNTDPPYPMTSRLSGRNGKNPESATLISWLRSQTRDLTFSCERLSLLGRRQNSRRR